MVGQSFGILFKKFRLKAEFSTLSEFGKVLAEEGFVYEDSIFSHWQKNNRVPKERALMLTVIKIFSQRGGINSLKEANMFLESLDQKPLSDSEIVDSLSSHSFSQGYSPKEIITFMSHIGRSKKIKRTGWVREEITNPESVAEHSFRLSVITMVLGDNLGVYKDKLIQMAILHDLGEVVTGDIVWARGSSLDLKKQAEKEITERKGLDQIFKIIDQSNRYLHLFEEMIERKTQEAKIFWQLDKLEMAMQALEYEKEQNKNLDEFFINADLQIYHPLLRNILKQIARQRPTKKKNSQLSK